MQLYNQLFERLPEYARLRTAAGNKTSCDVVGLSPIHKAGLIHSLTAGTDRRALCIVADEAEGRRLCEDINAMSGEDVALLFCSRDFTFRQVEGVSGEFEHARLAVLGRILAKDYRVIVASAEGASQFTVPPETLGRASVTLVSGGTHPLDQVLQALTSAGYQHSPQVDGVCQFSHRGGIVDFYPPDLPAPVRIEFWGDEIDTISSFDLESQRRTDTLKKVHITPATEVICSDIDRLCRQIRDLASKVRGKLAAEVRRTSEQDIADLTEGIYRGSLDKYLPLIYEKPATIFDYCPDDLLFVSETFKVKDTLKSAAWQHHEDLKQLFSEGILYKGLDRYTIDFTQLASYFEQRGAIHLNTFARSIADIRIQDLIHINASSLSVWGGELALLRDDLEGYLRRGFACVVLAGTPRAADTLRRDLAREGMPILDDDSQPVDGRILITAGALSAGFELPDARCALITHGRVAALTKSRAKARRSAKEIVRNLSDLTVGDYVVHVSHGIGIFEGIHKLEMQGVVKDYIKIRYQGADTLYVPVTQLDLVSKYIGPREDGAVRLNKLNSTEWTRTRSRVKKAVADMAKELIELYSKRMQQKGYAFSPDDDLQREFEERFEFDETDDQLRCIAEIKRDMQSSVPMDRLLCGDVGFGKTEVALRGAFKCVTDGKQCAILVPTTILAWQHYQTVLRRFEGYPVRIELLSRFRSPKEQEKIIRALARGEVDLIIGTHRLVQKDVRFKNLGLVIVDEEQRFGVAQKERLKELCTNVDVLTLSATPIPRTLNMAMSGIRDMSVIEEAPQDRHPVQTYVLEHDDNVLVEAMRRELRRGGQVYYIHNRIESIESRAAQILRDIPEARIATAHGRMGEEELSEVWRKLVDHEIDILVCTTIIETGVDVANCNTLIIEDADYMGLSQLYQLRGRVGRSSRRAFAYMTFRRGKVVSDIAAKRLTAIREFTKFGSGFRIAMRDLEIRGAGNILGGQQHGHMASVGYDLYVKLLNEAVLEQRGEQPDTLDTAECLIDVRIEAHIPEKYIEDTTQRIEVYRRIASIRNNNDVLDVIDELIDRFGEPPQAVRGLIDVALMRNRAARFGITEISQRGDSLLLYMSNFSMQTASNLVAALPGRVLFNAGNRPYLAVRMQKGEQPTDTITAVLDALDEQVEKNRAAANP